MNSLQQRGEQLNQLQDKTKNLQNDAMNFAEMAKKIRQDQEKKSTGFF